MVWRVPAVLGHVQGVGMATEATGSQAVRVLGLWDFRAGSDQTTAAFKARVAQLEADGDFERDQGTLVSEFSVSDAPMADAQVIAALGNQVPEGGHEIFQIRVEPDGAVGVLHCQGGSKAVLCTPTSFARPADKLCLSYSWDAAGGAHLSAFNMSTQKTETAGSDAQGLTLDVKELRSGADCGEDAEIGHPDIEQYVLLDTAVSGPVKAIHPSMIAGGLFHTDLSDTRIQAGEGDETVFSGSGSDTALTRACGDTLISNDETGQGGVAATSPRDDDGNIGTGVPGGDILALTETARASATGTRFEVKYNEDDPNRGVVTFFDADGHATGTTEFSNIERIVPCFTPGTLIATPKGERKVEDLQVGDRVITRDNGIQEIRWVGRRTLSGSELTRAAHLQPVLIREGALSAGLPERDMLVSPNHRMLVANDKTALYFEEREVLVAAKHLTGLKGVDPVEIAEVTYIHFMFDQHEVVLSDGAWSESFQPGDQSLAGMGNAQRNEIFEIFPELKTEAGRESYNSARRSLKKHEARLLM